MKEWEICYEDRNILVVYKPPGLAVQCQDIRAQDLESLLKQELALRGCPDPYLGVVHRLDQPVEGLLAFARTKKAAAELSAQVQDGRMKKKYLAVCCMSGESRMQYQMGKEYQLCHMLKKRKKDKKAEVTGEKDPEGKKAELVFQIRQQKEWKGKVYALLEITLKTGRFHQIRCQMAAVGMPLYGDRKYHPDWQSDRVEEAEKRGNTGLGLAAAELSFYKPGSLKAQTWKCEPKGEIFSWFQTPAAGAAGFSGQTRENAI